MVRAPADGPPEREILDEQLQIDHVRALFTQTPASLTGNFFGLIVMAATFWSLADRVLMLGWLGAGAALWTLRLLHYLRYRRQPRADGATLRRWRSSWRVLVLLQGAMWGVAVWLFWGLGEPYRRLALLLTVYAFCLGSVQLLSTQWRIFLAYDSLVLLPAIARVASDATQPWHLELAGVFTVLFGMTVLMAHTSRTALGQAIRLKARTEAMALQLRVEKSEAEAARRAAEAANRAKTQFFAAASHDLRQPLHAMGLFAEALRQRVHDPEVASLVNSINESVDALEGLFGELLDITRIDTGGVEVHPVPVPMQDLLARLRLHFEPIAFEKGLQLVLRGGRHVAQVDPVLIERVLRNLVSNAIRYTDDGGVLVACRARAGSLLIQVWDSGIGIPEATLPRIFEEFFQVQGQRALEPHHRKGLGLGLAIVKRLTDLMGSTIEVRSRVGHGTVFSFELPVGRLARTGPPVGPATRDALGLTLQGRLLLIVEDEPAVREGLEVLLKAWGASVVAFDSVDAVQAWLSSDPPQAPDLLLVDYRLPSGRTAVDALAAMRAHWAGRKLPAVVITGSSLGGHEAEAVEHEYHLLIKPVLPNKLRAMIAFKLGVRAGA